MRTPSSFRSRIAAAALVLAPVAALVAVQPANAQQWSDNQGWSNHAGRPATQGVDNTPRNGAVPGARDHQGPARAVPTAVPAAPVAVYPQAAPVVVVPVQRQVTWPFGFVTAANAENAARQNYAGGNHVGNDLP
jgi:hypothetical protein